MLINLDILSQSQGRFEYKYVVPLQLRDKFIRHAEPFLKPDSHSSFDGYYPVHTLYYDSFNLRNYYDKLAGKSLRYKIRLRYYPKKKIESKKDNHSFLELKMKYLSQIWKDRIPVPVPVPVDNVHNIFTLGTNNQHQLRPSLSKSQQQIFDKIYYLARRYQISPVSVICYKRQALEAKFSKHIRITFDTKVKVRRFNFDIQIGDGSHYVIPPNLAIMEIKFQKKLPTWLQALLPRLNSVNHAYSKYTEGLYQSTRLLQY